MSTSEHHVHDTLHVHDTIRPEIVDHLQAAEVVGEDRPHEDVLVFTIHDGSQIPRHLFGERTEEVLARPAISRAYLRERDWGSRSAPGVVLLPSPAACFEVRYPETTELLAYGLVWQMLFDVIRRSWKAELLRGYLHRYREAPLHERQVFSEARAAYFRIRDFLAAHRGELVEAYRFSRERPSCLGIEVRKDLLCDFDDHGARLKPNAEYVARDLARRIAWAVRRFLDEEDTRPADAAVTMRLEPVPV